MANLKETRNRIVSIKSTMQITSAMKMVSAAKLKRAQDGIVRMRPYAEKLKEILGNLSASTEDSAGSVYSTERPVNKVLVVPFSSNKGLCGGFNANVAKACLNYIQTDLQGKEVSVLAIGKKAGEWLKNRNINIDRIETKVYKEINFNEAASVAEELMLKFANGSYDQIVIVYNQFVNAAIQTVKKEQFLPILPNQSTSNKQNSLEYIYEPEKEEIIEVLIPKSLKTQFYKSLLDSNAGEHGARMTAMHQATDNANEMAKALTLKYNKARQAAITTEILEIVGGAEALDKA